MAQEQSSPGGPDLSRGVTLAAFKEGKLVGHVGDQEILLVSAGDEILAIDARCSHYSGPLVDGLIVDGTIRCPWHHACFDLRSGAALRPPALNALSCWTVERKDGLIVVREKRAQPKQARRVSTSEPESIVIVGGGAAGLAAADTLRNEGYRGNVTMVSSDGAPPVDRPNLSKDYLAGSAPEDWVFLRPESFYADAHIDLRLNTEIAVIDVKADKVITATGQAIRYDRLLLATGAEPVRLSIAGGQQSNVHVLRSLSDCRGIIAAAEGARRVVVIGASFIGLEVAAALRARGIDVHVAAPEKRPMERVLGAEMGDFVRGLHEEHGVVFHLQDTVTAIDGTSVTLKSGGTLQADLVIEGVGVRPRVALAEQAGLTLDRGVLVDAFLQTSAANIYAAGDIARWPDPRSGANIRVEHWVVAQRQGQTAARNMLGQRERFDAVPFFWSQHYDVPINYVGHAEQWDEIVVDGDIKARDCLVKYRANGRTLAVASIFRDLASLQAELEMERG